MRLIGTLFLLSATVSLAEESPTLPIKSLILDLDASKGVETREDDKVISWKNQITESEAKTFVHQDKGRKIAGSGCPALRKDIEELNGKPSLVFKQQELICMHEDAFDDLTKGSGHTWMAIICAYEQRVGVKDVNSFFGNLRNGGKYEGVWGCLDDDNTLWWGTRNGLTFGRFDKNNPKVSGPKLEKNKFHIIAGRMSAAKDEAKLELFIDEPNAVSTGIFPVNPDVNPSKMAIGQERDAIEHPGHESFDGEIARFLIWERPLSDEELQSSFDYLRSVYFPSE